MKQMQDFSNFILQEYPIVKELAKDNLELPYVVIVYFYDYFARLLQSGNPQDQKKAEEILQFLNTVLNGVEYDDDTKGMVIMEFFDNLIVDNQKEDLQMRLAKKYFTGEALDSLRFSVLNSNDNYRYKFPYLFDEDAEIIIDRLKNICKNNVYFDPDIPEYIRKNQKISRYKP